MATEVIYEGQPGGTVWRVESDDVTQVANRAPLRHHVKHSPTGFGWGYGGSGPAELARCLLIDALGDDARCPQCNGTGKVVWGDEKTVAFDPNADYVLLDEDSDKPQPGAVLITQCPECWGETFGPNVERAYQRFKFEVIATWPQHLPLTISRDEVLTWVEGDRLVASRRDTTG